MLLFLALVCASCSRLSTPLPFNKGGDSHSVLTTEPFFQKAEPKQKQHFRWCALRYSRYHDHRKFSRTEYRNTIMQPQKLRWQRAQKATR